MSKEIKIQAALISVHNKKGLDPIVKELNKLGVKIYSTGGTAEYIKKLKIKVNEVSKFTGFPEILGGRVKTLHPKVFGAILGRRENAEDVKQLKKEKIPFIDLVMVDLYPFSEVAASGAEEQEIVENIDIGGISLIRAAAKNFADVVVCPSTAQYENLLAILRKQKGKFTLEQRKEMAGQAFAVTAQYETSIQSWLQPNKPQARGSFTLSYPKGKTLRYGENPHQAATFYGDLSLVVDQIAGKELSYNNLVDIDAAIGLIDEFRDETAFAIIKHTNPCGVALSESTLGAFRTALECDPTSAYGGILITNGEVDLDTAHEVTKHFFEVLVAETFIPSALEYLKKKNRIILRRKPRRAGGPVYRSVLGGLLEMDRDDKTSGLEGMVIKTRKEPTPQEMEDIIFGEKVVKHLKSNAIAIVKNGQLLGAGVGQTSRVDAVKQAIQKAKERGFSLEGSVLASDAFFPFADSAELALKNKITVIVEPGGSVRDEETIKFCEQNQMCLVFTGTRHFKH